MLLDPAGTPWAIDFGACLLIDRLARGATQPRLDLPANHILAGRPSLGISPRQLAEDIDEGQLDGTLTELPEAWLGELGLARQDLEGRLKAYFRSVLYT